MSIGNKSSHQGGTKDEESELTNQGIDEWETWELYPVASYSSSKNVLWMEVAS